MDKRACDQSVQQRNVDGTNLIAGSSSTDNNDTGVLLQNMTEDCLLEIFSMESLELMDLCRLAETCKRFRIITQRVIIAKELDFGTNNRQFWFTSENFSYRTRSDDGYGNVERIFRNFGSCLSEIRIQDVKDRQQSFLLNMMKNHCDGELKLLSICKIRISAKLTKELEPVFRRIHTLILMEFSFEGHKSLFSELHALVELELIDVRNCGIILENIFPKLELFRCSSRCSRTRVTRANDAFLKTLKTFISSHSALKSLDLSLSCNSKWWTNILQEVETSCKNLETLIVAYSLPVKYLPISLKPIRALKSLKTVKLWCVSLEDFEVFTFLTELRELELTSCTLPEDVEQFSCLSQLTQLFLTCCMSSGLYDVADIIHHLVNLTEFEFELLALCNRYFVLDPAQFSKIVQIVKGRSNVLNLKCRYDFTVKRNMNEKVLLYRLYERNT